MILIFERWSRRANPNRFHFQHTNLLPVFLLFVLLCPAGLIVCYLVVVVDPLVKNVRVSREDSVPQSQAGSNGGRLHAMPPVFGLLSIGAYIATGATISHILFLCVRARIHSHILFNYYYYPRLAPPPLPGATVSSRDDRPVSPLLDSWLPSALHLAPSSSSKTRAAASWDSAKMCANKICTALRKRKKPNWIGSRTLKFSNAVMIWCTHKHPVPLEAKRILHP